MRFEWILLGGFGLMQAMDLEGFDGLDFGKYKRKRMVCRDRGGQYVDYW